MDETNVLEKRNKVKNMKQAYESYKKVKDVIKSCNNEDQLRVGVRMFNMLLKKYGGVIDDHYFHTLTQLLGLMRMKCGIEKEEEVNEIFNSGKDFDRATNLSGVPELQNLTFDESSEDLIKEINIGTQIERNHLDPIEAKELATQNVGDISDYYSNPDFCIIAVENKNGDKKTIRVETDKYKNSLGEEKLIMDDMEIFHEDLDMNNITQSLRDQLKKRNSKKYHPDEIFDKIGDLRNKELERREKEEEWPPLFDEDDIEESTGTGSSGQYTGELFSGEDDDIIRKKFYDIPVTKNGIVGNKQTGLPISKVFSYGGKQNESEILEEDDLDEATTAAEVGGVYDTPGFPPSEFMGTAGKKGKAPVNKGITHTKLAYPGGDFVKIKNRCARFPYCNQSPEAIKISKKPFKNAFYENRLIKKGELKLKK